MYEQFLSTIIPTRFIVRKRKWLFFYEVVAVFDTIEEAKKYIKENDR